MNPHGFAAAFSERAFGVALRIYPPAYRERFGPEMCSTFSRLNRDAIGRGGVVGGVMLWAREAGGLFKSALSARLAPGAGSLRPVLTFAGVFAAVLTVYIVTLAPSVTFWDAGEFIAASRVLGVPHPPGTPLYVFLSNVWASLMPFGEFAYRLNLLTAVFSAAAAAFLFLVVREALSQGDDDARDPIALGGAIAAVAVSAFGFTVWQNSNESEVYGLAAFGIAATAWLALCWRRHRGTARAPKMLYLMLYLAALAVGNHLLALLVGPAIVGFMFHVMRSDPLTDARAARSEWSQWMVLASTWVVLISVGLGNATLLIASGVALVLAAWFAATRREARFVIVAAALSVVGVSTYLFLYIRAGQAPYLNEGNPSTWDALLSMIRREQYPVRLPMDNPLYDSGPANPGRTLGLLALQIQNYFQYFDWQWSNGLETTRAVFAPIRLPFTLLFTTLGIGGLTMLRRRDRSISWMLLLVFLVTGPALVGYMNFKPGFSLGFAAYPEQWMHEVRERDYFFLVSFQMWGLFAGVGIAGAYGWLRGAMAGRGISPRQAGLFALPVFGVALVPLALNFGAANRADRPESQLARDFAYDLLQSVEPYGIIFTGGDNDTFPLFYAQAVEGVRPDVTVVAVPFAQTRWFVRQLRDQPLRRFDPGEAPWFAGAAPDEIPPPVHSLTDEEIASLYPFALPNDYRFQAGAIDHVYPQGTVMQVRDILTLRMIQENVGRRPIYFSASAGSDPWVRLGDTLVQEGLAYRLYSDKKPDGSRVIDSGGRIPIDLARTDSLAWDVFRYAELFAADSLQLDPTNGRIAAHMGNMFIALAQAHDTVGNREAALKNLEHAYHLIPNPAIRQAIQALGGPPPAFADTPAEQ